MTSEEKAIKALELSLAHEHCYYVEDVIDRAKKYIKFLDNPFDLEAFNPKDFQIKE